jgi:hypothetical protein
MDVKASREKNLRAAALHLCQRSMGTIETLRLRCFNIQNLRIVPSCDCRTARSIGPMLICCLMAWLCAACVPLRFTTSPGATGKIVDATTESPVTGAEVLISRSTYPPPSPDKAFANGRSPTVMSRDGGEFSVPLERRMDLYCFPIDVFPRFGLLVVKRPGYETTCIPFWSRSIADLGEIKVRPLQ